MPNPSDSKADQRRTRRVLNVKLLLATIAIISLIGVGVHFLHQFQLANVNKALRQRADAFREDADFKNAAKYLERYLRQCPDDAAAKLSLAEIVDLDAKSITEIRNTIALQFVAIGLCEANPDLDHKLPVLRRRLIERLIEVGRFEDALGEIGSLVGPELQPDLLRNIARCRSGLLLEGRADPNQYQSSYGKPEWFRQATNAHAVDLLIRALDICPGDLELHRHLFVITFQRPELLEKSKHANLSKEERDVFLLHHAQRLREQNPTSAAARVQFLEVNAIVDPKSASRHFEEALESFPDSHEVRRSAGFFFLRVARDESDPNSEKRFANLDLAQPILEKLAKDPDCRDVGTFAAWGEAHAMKGDHVEAIQAWKTGCQRCAPPTMELRLKIAESEIAMGSSDEARVALQELDNSIRKESIAISPAIQRELNRASKELWIRLFQKQRDSDAIQSMLDSLASGATSEKAETREETLEFIAFNYLKLGKWNKAIDAFQKAISINPSSERLLRGAANANMKMNRIDEANRLLRSLQSKTVDDLILLASISLELGIRNPVSRERLLQEAQQYTEVAKEAVRSGSVPSNPWMLDFIAMEISIQSAGEVEKDEIIASVAKDVVSLCEASPANADLWHIAIITLKRWGQTDAAAPLLASFTENHPNHSLSTLNRAESASQSGALSQSRAILLDAIAKDAQTDSLLRAYFLFCEADSEWPREINTLLPTLGNDIERIANTGRWALQVSIGTTPTLTTEIGPELREGDRLMNWDHAIRCIEDRLRALEGASGFEWRILQGNRLLRLASFDPKSDLNPLQEIASYLMLKRPDLPSGYTFSGVLSDREGKTSKAIAMYQKAIAMGESEFSVQERLCELLFREGRLDQAKSLLDTMGSRKDSSPRIASLAMQLSNDEPDRMLNVAKAGIQARPSDPMAWVWYATALEISSRGETQEQRESQLAEATLGMEEADRLAPNDLRVLVAQFNYFRVTKQSDRLPQIMDRLRSATDIPPRQRFVALGRMEHSQGNLEESIASFKQALIEGEDPISMALLIAQSQKDQRDIDGAISTLAAANRQSPQLEDVRQMLATVLAERGTLPDWEQMQRLLTSPPFGNSPSDLLLLAKLHTQRGYTSDLARAKSILERLSPDPSQATGEELFRLGIIALRSANAQMDLNNQREVEWMRNEAEQYLKQAIVQEPSQLEYRYVYGNLLLDRDRNAEAMEQARQMNIIDRDQFESRLLLARAMQANEDTEDAILAMDEWLATQKHLYRKTSDYERRMASLGQAAVGFMMLNAKERSVALLQEIEQEEDSSSLNILATLMRVEDQRLRSTAIELLLEQGAAAGLQSPRAVSIGILLARTIGLRKLSAGIMEKIDLFLTGVQSSNPKELALQRTLADYWLIQNRTTRAIESFRTVIAMTPEDPIAINNLACLLGESVEGCKEALVLIDRAIELLGVTPDLLDSKGSILMRSGDLQSAVTMFETAAEKGRDPRIILHWYIALKRLNRLDEAKEIHSRIDRERLRRVPLTEEEEREIAALK
jgi:tetratricopeptide (TPR) repeat protein